tara:strand:- start:135 stop:587 length:453 start_codon:yes stop_codon:yes gene_type:complete
MFSVENFKPVKDLSTFESMYLKALDKIKKKSEQKRQLFNSYKKSCIFNKNIFIYKKNNETVGFCMYEKTEDEFFLIFDYAEKGAGRKCRIELVNVLKKITPEFKFLVSKSNFLSKNSVKKVYKKHFNSGFLREEDDNSVNGYITYTAIFT